jgi:hypothetical protein
MDHHPVRQSVRERQVLHFPGQAVPGAPVPVERAVLAPDAVSVLPLDRSPTNSHPPTCTSPRPAIVCSSSTPSSSINDEAAMRSTLTRIVPRSAGFHKSLVTNEARYGILKGKPISRISPLTKRREHFPRGAGDKGAHA